MITITKALEILSNNNITKSEQVLRRWLRNGKIKNAKIINKKTGWQIDEQALQDFIFTKQNKSNNKNNDYHKGYKQGYEDCLKKFKKKDKERLSKYYAVFENEYYIDKASVLEVLERRYSYNKSLLKELKEYYNNNIFKHHNTKKNNVVVLNLGDYYKVTSTKDVFDIDFINKISDLTERFDIQERLTQFIINYYSTNNKKSNINK